MKLGSKIANYISKKNREMKYRTFMKRFCPTAADKVLDVGAIENEHSPVCNFLEKKYPWQENITVLGVDKYSDFKKRYPAIKVFTYDGSQFPFEDKSFDICWSNAVLEHVGDRASQLFFINEIARVSKRAYLTTPNKYFPIEVHTRIPLLHYLPKKLFDKFLTAIGKRWATGNYMNLLTRKQLVALLDDSEITGYQVVKNKILFWTIDFSILLMPD